ncbi:heterokaryon incompatibility protein-domain-containing protein [Microdochium trichocladiopsis]|uniref:Heterokaryon incompatibility protein-domain-containing protein n=1 Tax=Microdochium trichocladiopsis TaxID=1682393 RepID=A0A9P8XW84_9PEZI|nr:heterokaryon incompatibility protein-domain-containing protein [Microdochium trichocladiopsis]KAH7018471.1 heterokaryon incompatibility protein-domain-containing protein [Microdochium trichocladiopsis]
MPHLKHPYEHNACVQTLASSFPATPCRPRSRSVSGGPRQTPQWPSHDQRRTGSAAEITADTLMADSRIVDSVGVALASVTYSRVFSLVGAEVGLDPPLWLCDPCKALVQSPPPPIHQNDVLSAVGATPPESYWRLHHANLFQLVDCCFGWEPSIPRRYCQLCQVIWRGIRRQLAGRRAETTEGRSRCNPSRDPLHDWLGSPSYLNCHVGLRTARVFTRNGCDLNFNIPLPPPSRYGERWFSLLVRPTHRPRSESLLSSYTGSAQVFKQIRDWIDTCHENHHLCQDESHPFEDQPTRLIQVDRATNQVRLIDTMLCAGLSISGVVTGTTVEKPDMAEDSAEVKAYGRASQALPYVALSYRWGIVSSSSRLLLTANTERSLRAGVSMADLPRTIQDACAAVLGLGYQYLWVDRLCIFQDSSEDWNREATRMAQVYKHAVLVLAASCAVDEDAPLFRNRGPAGGGVQPLWLCSIPLALDIWPTKKGHSAEMMGEFRPQKQRREQDGYSIDSHHANEDDPLNGKLGHLASRGWAYQERVLAKRIAHFSSEEIHWECHTLEQSESNSNRQTYGLERPTVDMLDPNVHWDMHYNWCSLVTPYSSRKLTFPKDRLPALSGLAKETKDAVRQDVPAEAYYAGLWRSTFIADLCWGTSFNEPRGPLDVYTAPSWSWASHGGRVGWSIVATARADVYPLVSLQDVNLQHPGGDVYGVVDDGWVILRGHCLPVSIGLAGPGSPSLGSPARISAQGRHGGISAFAMAVNGAVELEALSKRAQAGSLDVQCLPVCKGDDKRQEFECWCLLLAPRGALKYNRVEDRTLKSPSVASTVEYERVGWIGFQVTDKKGWDNWLAGHPREDVVIW